MSTDTTIADVLEKCTLHEEPKATADGKDEDRRVQLEDFPVELLQHLLELVDGQTLMRSRRVCWKWKELVDCLETLNVWKACCLREITEDTLQDLMSCSNDFLPDSSSWWKAIYQSWHELAQLGKPSRCFSTAAAFVSIHVPISCILIKGPYVVSGHRNGEVHVWDRTSGEYLFQLFTHDSIVIGLVALNDSSIEPSDRFLYLASSSKFKVVVHRMDENKDLKFWSFGRPDRGHDFSFIELIADRNTLVAHTEDHKAIFWCLKSLHDDSNFSVDCKISAGPPGGIWIIGYHKSVLKCIGCDGDLWTKDKTLDWICRRFVSHNSIRNSNSLAKITIARCFILRGNIYVFVSVDHHLIISVDGPHYSMFASLIAVRSSIISVTIGGSIFALGTERGAIYLYNFKHPQELLDLNLSSPTWRSQVTTGASIISIDIGPHPTSPVVVCASSDTVYILKWKLQCPNTLPQNQN